MYYYVTNCISLSQRS